MRGMALVFVAVSAAWPQDANVLTITASRQVNAIPDQVNLSVQVITNVGATLDQVLGYLQGTKITAADMASVSSLPPGGSPGLEWIFRPTAALSDLPAWMAALRTADLNSAVMISYFVQGASFSAQAQASACPYPAVLNDARVQASKLAAAAGLRAGPIVSIAQGGSGPRLPVAYAVYDVLTVLVGTSVSPASYTGSPASYTGSPVSYTGLLNPTPACSLTVQFELLQ